MERTHKFVNDLGVAAYVMMHGYTFVGKKARSVYFECENQESATEFDKLIIEYQPPNEFYIFDSCLMYLKKINEFVPEGLDEATHKCVSDLGAAAYLLMLECDKDRKMGVKMVGKKGKYVHFYHPEGKEKEFERRSYQYVSSQFQTYDANLMALKKIGEHML